MTTFIPFDIPGGNPKQIAPEVFSAGQEIKVKATGTLDGAVDSPLTKESAAVQIISAVPSTSIGNVLISGQTNPVTGTEYAYTATADGDAGTLTYVWSTSPATSTIDHGAPFQNSAGITFDADDTYDVICTITSGDANPSDSPKTASVKRTSAAASSTEIFDIDFTGEPNSTDVYIDDSTTADIDGITFGNYIETGTVWKVGKASNTTPSNAPYNTEVHLYKDSISTSNDFSAAMAGDIGTLPTAWTMEGIVAEGADPANSDYGWMVACSSDGQNQVRAVINSSTATSAVRIRTRINGTYAYQATASLSQAINSTDQQFLRASYDGTTLTVTAWDGTDDTGTLLATTSTTTLPTLGTNFGFLAASGSTNTTRSRSAFSMKLTDDS